VPVREALTRLESEGLVALRPRRGYTVVSLSPDDIREISDICERLEELAALEATRRRTPDDVAALDAILAEMDRLGSLARGGDQTALPPGLPGIANSARLFAPRQSLAA
jgi:DNA-binding GntR family transcriptional regulator